MFATSTYVPVYYAVITILTLFIAQSLKNKSAYQIGDNSGNRGALLAIILSAAIALFIGSRPATYAFGDTGNYAHQFNLVANGQLVDMQNKGEWLWMNFVHFCTQATDIKGFLTLHDLLYVGLTCLACIKMAPRNALTLLLFNLASFSFFSYGTNGLRNGLACSAMLVSMTFAMSGKTMRLTAFAIGIFATAVHKSTMLPFAMMIASIYFIKSFKWAYSFWILSIFLSLFIGNTLSNFLAGLSFDDRLHYYIANDAFDHQFSHTGFRFDFLIYSMMPIILGYYIIMKKGIRDTAYEILLNTYTLSNAFWVIVIRASFSNRFAYLSWFLYPVVLAYPLLKMDIWGERQGAVASKIMLAHLGFTLFMTFVYG